MAINSYREDEFMENTDKKKILKRLLSYLLEYRATILFVLLCMGITVAISLVNPLIIEEALDTYVANGEVTSREYMDKLEHFIRVRTDGVKNLNNQYALRQMYEEAAKCYKK